MQGIGALSDPLVTPPPEEASPDCLDPALFVSVRMHDGREER